MTKNTDEMEKIKTSCNNCIFAEMGIVFPTSIQEGCSVGRIEKFKKSGHARLDEDTNSFFIIDGVCNTCRGETWKKAHAGQNLIATVEREIEICMDIVLYSIDNSDNIENKIYAAVKSCVNQQKIKPKKLIIVLKNDTASYKSIYEALQSITTPHDIPFQLVRVIEEESDINRCIAMGMDKCTSQFLSTFDLLHKIPINFIKRFNILINEDMRKIIMLTPMCGYSGMVLQTNVFKALGKNRTMPIFTKVQEIAEDQGYQNMILKWEELWNQE